MSASHPRMLLVNGPWDHLGARIRRGFIEPLHRLLELDFEVIDATYPCDLVTAIETHQPDVILLHTGMECPNEPMLELTGTEHRPDIPRIGYIWRDPFAASRTIAMSRLHQWGVRHIITAFRPSDAPISYFRDTYYLPFWADDTLYHEYGEEKTIPVSLTGAGWFSRCIYEWRQDLCFSLLASVPLFHAPSLGNHENGFDITGENYARLLNRSWFCAGDGSVNRYLTLKLFEIPASRSCLLTQDIAMLRHIGFRDGENCVFVEGKDAATRVHALLREPERLQAIIDRGYQLIQAGHTQRHRKLFIDLYRNLREAQDGERIVQVDPFKPLVRVPPGQPIPPSTCPTENPLVDNLLAGYQHLANGDYSKALNSFDAVLRIIPWVAEARLGVTLAYIRLGRDREAAEFLKQGIELMLGHFKSPHPDPVEWAFFALICARLGDVPTALQHLQTFPEMRHPALNTLRWLARQVMPGGEALPEVLGGDMSTTHLSVHLLEFDGFQDWVELYLDFLHKESPQP